MARTDFDMQVAGLMELVEGLRTMQGPELTKVIGASASRTMRAVVVPAMKRQMAADFQKEGSHKDRKGKDGSPEKPKRGQSGPAARNVTVRKVRKRSGELIAIGAGPRAWYAHFPIGGTKAHVISATGRGPYGRSAPGSVVRSINREESGGSYLGPARRSGRHGTTDLTRGGKALFINGFYRERVRHPGSRGTDSIRKAVQGVTGQLNERYARDLQAAYDKHIAGPTRKAKPKP